MGAYHVTDNLFVAYKPLISSKSCRTSYHHIYFEICLDGISCS